MSGKYIGLVIDLRMQLMTKVICNDGVATDSIGRLVIFRVRRLVKDQLQQRSQAGTLMVLAVDNTL